MSLRHEQRCRQIRVTNTVPETKSPIVTVNGGAPNWVLYFHNHKTYSESGR